MLVPNTDVSSSVAVYDAASNTGLESIMLPTLIVTVVDDVWLAPSSALRENGLNKYRFQHPIHQIR